MNTLIILVIESPGDGGTEVYVEGLARHLSKYNSVEIVSLSGNPITARNRFLGLHTTTLSGPAALRELLQERACAVVNLHLYTSLLPAARAVRAAKLRLLITLHQPLIPWNAWHQLRWRFAVALADQVIGVSRACLMGFGPFLRQERSSVVSGPLPLDTMPLPSPYATTLCLPCILYVGRLSPEKDLPTLLRAVSMLDGVRLDIVGDGAERESCERLANKLGLNVCFYGALSRNDVFKIIQTADIFVLPSRFEGLGIAAVEAMALGIPTVVADFPAASEYIVPERTGLLFPVGDYVALAQCISRLIQEPSLRRTLSFEGSRHVRDVFSENTQFGKYDSLFPLKK